MKRSKVLYVLSGIEKSLSFEWVVKGLKDEYEFYFILLGDGKQCALSSFLDDQGIRNDLIAIHSKLYLLRAFFHIIRSILRFRPRIIHAHLFEGYLFGIVAGWILRVPYRVYTRHHSTIHHLYYPKGVKFDLLINRLSTHIIAPCINVANQLKLRENVADRKIQLIYHGFDLKDFNHVSEERTTAVKSRHGIRNGYPVIGVIARYIHCKGHEYVIKAFNSLIKEYPEALLILANSKGDYLPQIKEALTILPNENYREILFENDITALYHTFDLFVHIPIDDHIEAFGQTYVEALAAGIPSVFTISGIAHEFIVDQENALVVDYKNSDQLLVALRRLASDTELKQRLIVNGSKSVKSFDVVNMTKSLSDFYAGFH